MLKLNIYWPGHRSTDHFLSKQFLFFPVCSDYNVFSNFTLAFFEDSGWYKVNYTFVNNYDQFELQWGKGINSLACHS